MSAGQMLFAKWYITYFVILILIAVFGVVEMVFCKRKDYQVRFYLLGFLVVSVCLHGLYHVWM